MLGISHAQAPCHAGDKSLPAKEPLGVIDLDRFSWIASYWRIWEIYLNIKEIYQLKVTKENRKSTKLHYSQWLISWQRFVLHMLRMWHGDRLTDHQVWHTLHDHRHVVGRRGVIRRRRRISLCRPTPLPAPTLYHINGRQAALLCSCSKSTDRYTVG